MGDTPTLFCTLYGREATIHYSLRVTPWPRAPPTVIPTYQEHGRGADVRYQQQSTSTVCGLWIFQPRCRQALRAHNAVGMYPDPDGIASSSSIVPVDCITICQRQVALLSSGWHRQATSLLVLHTTSGALYRYDLARQPSYHRPSAAAAAVPAGAAWQPPVPVASANPSEVLFGLS